MFTDNIKNWLDSYKSNKEIIHVKMFNHKRDLLLVNSINLNERFYAISISDFNRNAYNNVEYVKDSNNCVAVSINGEILKSITPTTFNFFVRNKLSFECLKGKNILTIKTQNNGSYIYEAELTQGFFQYAVIGKEYYVPNSDGYVPIDFSQSIEITSRGTSYVTVILREYTRNQLTKTNNLNIEYI